MTNKANRYCLLDDDDDDLVQTEMNRVNLEFNVYDANKSHNLRERERYR